MATISGQWRSWGAPLLLAVLCGCGEDAPRISDPVDSADVGSEDAAEEEPLFIEGPRPTPAQMCPGGQRDEDGICTPELPRAAADCPEGDPDEDGLCPAQPPRLDDWDCPPGWASVSVVADGEWTDLPGGPPPTACEPPRPATDCPDGTRPAVGTGQCVQVGSACPEPGSPWQSEAFLRAAAPAHSGRIWYVGAVDSPAPDGTAGAPFRNVPDALAAAQPGDIVALARGRYTTPVSMESSVALVGACPRETLLGSTRTTQAWAVQISAGGTLLANLSVAQGGPGVLVLAHPDTVGIHGVVLDTRDAGVRAVGGGRTELDGVLARTVGGAEAVVVAVLADMGAEVVVRDASIVDTLGFGVLAFGGDSVVELTDSLVTEVAFGDSGGGVGVFAGPTTTVRIIRSLVSGSRGGQGVLAAGGSRVELVDAVIQDTDSNPADGFGGEGIYAEMGAVVVGERLWVRRSQRAALVAFDAGTTVDFAKAVLSDNLRGDSGLGILVFDVDLALRQTVLARNGGAGVLSFAGHVVAEDVLVLGATGDDSPGAARPGIDLQPGGSATLQRVVVAGAVGAGIVAVGSGLEVTGLDLFVLASVDTDSAPGFGVLVGEGAQLELVRVVVADVGNVGVLVADADTRADITDLRVAGVTSAPSDVPSGVGLYVSGGAVTVARAHIVGFDGAGVLMNRRGAGQLSDVYVRPAADARMGVGVVLLDAQVRAERVLVTQFAQGGVAVLGSTDLALSDFTITDATMRGVEGWGRGMEVGGGTVVLQRGSVIGARNLGIGVLEYASIPAPTASLDSVTITDTHPSASGRGGVGLLGQGDVTIDASHLRLRGNTHGGLDLYGAAHATVTDCRIEETMSRPIDGSFGHGVHVQGEARLALSRCIVTSSHQAGLLVLGQGAEAVCEDLEVLDTAAAQCALDPEPCGRSGGVGVATLEGASVTLVRFRVAGSALAGLYVEKESECVGRWGVVEANRIGLASTGEPPSLEHVTIAGNDANFSGEELALPGANALVSGLDLDAQ